MANSPLYSLNFGADGFARQLHRALFNSKHTLVAVLDADFNFLAVNDAYAAADGKPPEYFLGKNHFDLYPHVENHEIFHRCVRTGEDFVFRAKPFEYARNPERSVTHWDWSLTPIRDEHGTVVSVVLVVLNVTDRVNAIEALSENERRLQQLNENLECIVLKRTQALEDSRRFNEAIVDTVGALVVAMDMEGRIVRFNRSCEWTSGYTSAEAIGKIFWDFALPDDERATVQAKFRQLREKKLPNQYESQWVRKDGGKRLVAWSNTCITDSAGEIAYLIGTGMDITECKQAERALRASEEQFRLLANHIRDVYWLVSPDHRTLYYVSPAYESVWGCTVEDLYADPRSFMDFVHPDDWHVLETAYWRQKEGDYQDNYCLEYRIVRPDGEQRHILSRYWPIRNELNAVYCVAGVNEDITERKLAEERRVEFERLQKEALVREVHHRIKNNLQGVVGLLRRHASQEPSLGVPMSLAITQVKTMALVHGLQGSETTERVSLCELCEAIAESVQEITGCSVAPQFRRTLNGPVEVLQKEAVPLALVLNELLFNSFKHRDPADAAPVTVTLTSKGEAIEIVIFNSTRTPLESTIDLSAPGLLGTGLTLVRALMPGQATLLIRNHGRGVETVLRLWEPLIACPGREPLADPMLPGEATSGAVQSRDMAACRDAGKA